MAWRKYDSSSSFFLVIVERSEPKLHAYQNFYECRAMEQEKG